MAFDIEIIETGNGGDAVLTAHDFSIIFGWENMPYLALFGGNPGFSTPVKTADEEQNFDWWGNALLIPNEPGIQFNSLTEFRLANVSLNSEGRLLIEDAVKKDLKFMDDFATVDVVVTIPTVDHVRIQIFVKEPGNQQEKEFIFILGVLV